ncbi:MAG: PqqD family protein [Lachnospiraceae bacterium]|nr:PqqD family protein [Lachnospiraceae bacterium]
MIRNNDYILKEINNIPCLIPVGQAKAMRKSIISINTTGAYIWECFSENLSNTEVIDKVINYYGPNAKEKNDLICDISSFINSLSKMGLLLDSDKICSMNPQNQASIILDAPTDIEATSVSIADIHINIYAPENILPKHFFDFIQKESPSQNLKQDSKISIHFIEKEAPEFDLPDPIIETLSVNICETKNHFVLSYKKYTTMNFISRLFINKDTYETYAYYETSLNNASTNPDSESKTLRAETDTVIRTVFSLVAAKQNLLMLHSVSILYKNKAILFSAPSGTGKSTHANLWKKLFDINQINGDINVLKEINGEIVACGTPWCGTSGIYSKETFPVGAIIFLKRDSINAIDGLSDHDKSRQLISRLFNPLWNSNRLDSLIKNAETVTKTVPCAILRCTKDDEAAIVCKNYLNLLS